MRKYLIALLLLVSGCGLSADGGERATGLGSIAEGGIPKPEEFSLAAFVSGHTYDFPNATTDVPVRVVGLTSFVANPQGKSPRALLLIGLDTRRTETVVRSPVDLVAVIDRSGSMAGDKISQTRAAVKSLARQLSPGDRLAIVAYDDAAQLLLPLTGSGDLSEFDGVAEAIEAGGSTNIHAGLKTGYAVFDAGGDRTRWVVLLSDGLPSAGDTSPGGIVGLVDTAKAQGIGTSAIAVGGDADTNLMARIAAAGGGTYYFLNDPSKLADTFSRELTRVSTPVADDFSLAFHLTDAYMVNEVYGFTLENTASTPAFKIPRVFYQERPGAFLVDLTLHPGANNAADWGVLDAQYTPIDAPAPVTQSVAIGLPFDPESGAETEYYEHTAVRKGYVVLAAGLGIEEAIGKFWTDHDPDAAAATLDAAMAEFDRRKKPLGADDELTADRALLEKLRENIAGYPAPETGAP